MVAADETARFVEINNSVNFACSSTITARYVEGGQRKTLHNSIVE